LECTSAESYSSNTGYYTRIAYERYFFQINHYHCFKRWYRYLLPFEQEQENLLDIAPNLELTHYARPTHEQDFRPTTATVSKPPISRFSSTGTGGGRGGTRSRGGRGRGRGRRFNTSSRTGFIFRRSNGDLQSDADDEDDFPYARAGVDEDEDDRDGSGSDVSSVDLPDDILSEGTILISHPTDATSIKIPGRYFPYDFKVF
jgi:hypothetical protein